MSPLIIERQLEDGFWLAAASARASAIPVIQLQSGRSPIGQAKAFRIGKLPVRTWERKIQS
ncbi:hypothetical protein NRB_04850 [Novosphingobium sp. 11B]